MTTFFDYDYRVLPGGREVYVLQADMRPLPVGKCVISNNPREPQLGWQRLTVNHSRHGKRYEFFRDLDAALTSGIAWARRKERERTAESV